MARLFKLSELDPLKCHKEDCVPNVLSYLNLLERDEAFKFANVNDQIMTKHIIDFLTDTYGLNHKLLEIYNTKDEPTPDMVDEILDEQNTIDFLDDQLKNNTVTIALFLGKVNHLALFGKINHEIYIIDVQTGEQISMNDPNVGLYLYKFNEIYLFATEGNKMSKIKVRNSTRFKKNAYMYTIKKRIRTNPNAVRWSRYLLQHSGLVPSKKYKIINKLTNKSIANSVFLRFEGKNAVFEDIVVPTAEHFFIEMISRSRSKFRSLRSLRSLRSKSLRSKSLRSLKSRSLSKPKHSI